MGKEKKKWKISSDPKKTKKRGGITITETKMILDYYTASGKYSFDDVKKNGGCMNMKKWFKTLKCNTNYIVFIKKHAFFVEVLSKRGK